jgi:hypothetical protein
LDSTEDIDCELAVAGNLHRRVCDLSPGFRDGGGRGIDVLDQQVGPDDRFLRLVHRGTHADHSAVGQRRCTGVAKAGVAFSERHSVQVCIDCAGSIDLRRYDLEIVCLHRLSRP